jgi:outer membrane protein assembly factor BamE (lipoprotein component of BamABCDE complex)
MEYEQIQFDEHQGVNLGVLGDTLFDNSQLKTEAVIFIIGKDGKVADIKRVAGDGHSTGLLVKDDYPHPDITKVDQIQPRVTTQEQVNTLLGAPPLVSISQDNTGTNSKMWDYNSGQFRYLTVVFGRNGIVDEVKKYFRGYQWSPKRVNADKVAQIKERQSTRQTAESVLGSPQTLSRNVQGSFYTYYIQMGKIKEDVYIEYDSSRVITRLIRKPLPQ